jgi:hypothetical protein
MAYRCPRCSSPVKRGSSTTAGAIGGALGALVYAAFGNFQCGSCGPIAKLEFSKEDQNRMVLGSVGLVALAIAVLVLVMVLLGLR